MSVSLKECVKGHVDNIAPYSPGKPIEILEQQLGIKNALKFASNENPLGPSPLAIKAIRESTHLWNRYPDSTSFFLRQRLSEQFGLSMDQFVIGNGSNELIELVCHLFLGPGDEAVVGHPSFPMFKIAIDLMGAKSVMVPLKDHRFDLGAMGRAVSPRTKIVFVCNPNNPTGTIVTEPEVQEFMRTLPESVIVVFDEAYHEYVQHKQYPDSLRYLKEGRLVVTLRTFSKVYALAGLRVGYGISSEEMIALINRVRMPFNVSCVGQVAALASLDDKSQLSRSVKVNSEGMAFFERELSAMGLGTVKSEANFFLVDLKMDGRTACDELERRGLIVRSMGPFGLPGSFVRIAMGTQRENERLVEGLKEVLGGRKPKKGKGPSRKDHVEIP
ncbi:MAG: histidinol-phosphate transaminase [Candidatus Eiseniibacteriota bacterium]|nr:MAG: histidinol-phosphate transaminase [Candidatus Eisenbacteria bacterium]